MTRSGAPARRLRTPQVNPDMKRGRSFHLPRAFAASSFIAAAMAWFPASAPARYLLLELSFDPASVRVTPANAGVDIDIPGFEPAPDASGRLLPFRVITLPVPSGMRAVSVRAVVLETRELGLPAPPRMA